MPTNYRNSRSSNWYDFETFRYMFVTNAIVAAYLLLEMRVSLWEISRNSTLLPDTLQLWFNFGHDQVFAYTLLLATTMKSSDERVAAEGRALYMQQSLLLSSLLSGFWVACYLITGSRFHL